MNETPFLNHEQRALLREQYGKMNDSDFATFVMQIERTRLDPFARQIYAIARWNSQARKETWAVQASIDGFRLIAQRSGEYEGQTGPHWCAEDGNWVDVWLSDKPPVAARVGVYRNGFREPCWGVAKFAAFAGRTKDGGLNMFWARMPDHMIAKVAEALALRKAFPQELSGLYTSEEIPPEENGHAEPKPPAPPAAPEPKANGKPAAPRQLNDNPGSITQDQIEQVDALIIDLGWTPEKEALVFRNKGLADRFMLSEERAALFIQGCKEQLAKLKGEAERKAKELIP